LAGLQVNQREGTVAERVTTMLETRCGVA